MKDTVKRWGAALLDPFGVQIYFILFSFMSEIPLIMAYVQPWKKVGLIWAALVILFDLFTRRRCLKAHFALPVLGLLAAYAVTTVTVRFAYPEAFHATYLDLFCSAVALLVLYPPTADEPERALRRLSLLNWLLAVLTTVVAAVSLWMFLMQVGGYLHSEITQYDYPIGFINKRLAGLYRNAIYPTPLIGLMAAVIEWTRLRGRAVWQRVLLALCVLLNALQVVLSYARGNTIAMAFFLAVVVLFAVRRRWRGAAPARLHWKAWLSGALCAAVVGGLVWGLATPVRQTLAYLPPAVQRAIRLEQPFSAKPQGEVAEDSDSLDTMDDEDSADTLPPDKPVDTDRDTSSRGKLTGRPVIWKQGLDYFLERPVFGYGPYALKDDIRISETSNERLSHFHNIFIQSLVSVGVVGSVFFFTLLIGAAWCVLRHLLMRPDARYHLTLAAIGAMLITLLLINMADTTLFFLSKNSEFVFWTYLGYAMLLPDGKPYAIDRPVQWLDSRLTRQTKGN